MTTEKFTEGAETFTKSVNNAMKWFQDTTTAIIVTQNKQMEFATDMYSKGITNSLSEMKKENFISSFSGMSEKMMEMMQKNVETIVSISNATLKTIMEFGKQTDSTPYSKEMLNTLIESFNKQVDVITAVNQKSFDFMTTQLNTSKTVFTPTLEKSKKEFEANFKLSKEAMQEIVDSYTKLKTPTIESSQKMFDELNSKINGMVSTNVNVWSELLRAYNEKVSETKTVNGLFKKNAFEENGSAKTHGTKESTKI